MSVTVCVSSTGVDGTLIVPVKALLGIAGASDDALLGTLATRALDAIETYLGRPLGLQVYSETVPAYGTRTLMLSRTPIRCVLRMFDSTDTGTAAALASSEYRIEDADAGFLSREAGFTWTAPIATEFVDFYRPWQESQPWLVEYGAGYRVVGATSTGCGVLSTGADLPGDIAQALDETVKGWYLARQQDPNVQSVTVGSMSLGFRDPGAAAGTLPISATRLLARHRRLA